MAASIFSAASCAWRRPAWSISDLTGSLLLSQDEVTVSRCRGPGQRRNVVGGRRAETFRLDADERAAGDYGPRPRDGHSRGAENRGRSRPDARRRPRSALPQRRRHRARRRLSRADFSRDRLPAGVAVLAHHDSARRTLGHRCHGPRHPPDDRRGHRRRQQLRAAGAGRRRADRGDARGADSDRPGRSPRRRTHFSRRQRLSDRRQRRDRFFQSHAHRARPADHGADARRRVTTSR